MSDASGGQGVGLVGLLEATGHRQPEPADRSRLDAGGRVAAGERDRPVGPGDQLVAAAQGQRVQHVPGRDQGGGLRLALGVDDVPGALESHLGLGGATTQDREIGEHRVAQGRLPKALDHRHQRRGTHAVAGRDQGVDGADEAVVAAYGLLGEAAGVAVEGGGLRPGALVSAPLRQPGDLLGELGVGQRGRGDQVPGPAHLVVDDRGGALVRVGGAAGTHRRQHGDTDQRRTPSGAVVAGGLHEPGGCQRVDRGQGVLEPGESRDLAQRRVLPQDREGLGERAAVGTAAGERDLDLVAYVGGGRQLGVGPGPAGRWELVEQRDRVARAACRVPGEDLGHRRMQDPSAQRGELADGGRVQPLDAYGVGGDLAEERGAAGGCQHHQHRCLAMAAQCGRDRLQREDVGEVGVVDQDQARLVGRALDGPGDQGVGRGDGVVRRIISTSSIHRIAEQLAQHRARAVLLPRTRAGRQRRRRDPVRQAAEQRGLAQPRVTEDQDGGGSGGTGESQPRGELAELVLATDTPSSFDEHGHTLGPLHAGRPSSSTTSTTGSCGDRGTATATTAPSSATPAKIWKAVVLPTPAATRAPPMIGPTIPPSRPKPAHQATPAPRARVG